MNSIYVIQLTVGCRRDLLQFWSGRIWYVNYIYEQDNMILHRNHGGSKCQLASTRDHSCVS